MKNFTFELNDKQINLRLTSQACEQIEKAYNCTLLDYVQQSSITSIVTLLMYMRNGAGETITRNMAHDFYDELVDAGYTMARILDEIVYEGLVVSGVISQEDLDNIRAEREKIQNMSAEEKARVIAERKNLQK